MALPATSSRLDAIINTSYQNSIKVQTAILGCLASAWQAIQRSLPPMGVPAAIPTALTHAVARHVPRHLPAKERCTGEPGCHAIHKWPRPNRLDKIVAAFDAPAH